MMESFKWTSVQMNKICHISQNTISHTNKLISEDILSPSNVEKFNIVDRIVSSFSSNTFYLLKTHSFRLAISK